MKTENKLKLAKAAQLQKAKEVQPDFSEVNASIGQLSSIAEKLVTQAEAKRVEAETVYLKLNDLYGVLNGLVDKVDIKTDIGKNSKSITELNNNIVNLMIQLQQDLKIGNLKEITPLTELAIKNLGDIKIPALPKDLAKEQTIKELNGKIVKLLDEQLKVARQKPSSSPDDYIPFRRVRVQNGRLLFDDSTWSMAGGFGGGGTTDLKPVVDGLTAILNKIDTEVDDEIPGGLINGSNKNFTTFYNYKPGTTKLFLNGLRQREGLGYDYIENGSNQLTFNSAPINGDTILVDYGKL